jgi:hypothetical protein
MYCPGCSTQATEGAKFCKSCGMNLTVVTQALTGGVLVVSDPLRDREFKRARKQITDGIHGLSIGAAIVVVAVLCYVLIPAATWVYVLTLALVLAGIVKLFRSIGSIVDARVGPKLLDPSLQPRATGGLSQSNTGPVNRPSGRLAETPARPSSPTRSMNAPPVGEKPVERAAQPPAEPPSRLGTGRINREQSAPLRRVENDEDLMSLLRN